MRIKFNKEIEYFIKKNFFPERFILKKRLIRSIKKGYDQEISLLDKVINNPPPVEQVELVESDKKNINKKNDGV